MFCPESQVFILSVLFCPLGSKSRRNCFVLSFFVHKKNATAQPAVAVAQLQVRSRISICQPSPFYPQPGDPSLPWRTWYTVFETYLLLLEEERGVPLSNLMKNSLLFSLLGTEVHKQFSGNPAPCN